MAYHHGDLANALVAAGVELARAGGPHAVVMRKVAALAGVSHNAAYRHFSDRGELLTAIGRHALDHIASEMERNLAAITETNPQLRAVLRLTCVGRTYVQAALAEPGLFASAFVAPGVTLEEPGPFEVLTRELDGLHTVGLLSDERRHGAEMTCWSAVHGFAHLHLQGPLAQTPPHEREAALDFMLGQVLTGLVD